MHSSPSSSLAPSLPFFFSLVQTIPALCFLQAAPGDEVQVDMRGSTAGQLPQTKDSWFFYVCAWDLGVVGKNPQKEMLSLRSRNLQVKFKDVFPKLGSSVLGTEKVFLSIPLKKRDGTDICLWRMTKWHWHIVPLETRKALLIFSEGRRSREIVVLFEKRRGVSYTVIFHFSANPFLS